MTGFDWKLFNRRKERRHGRWLAHRILDLFWTQSGEGCVGRNDIDSLLSEWELGSGTGTGH